MGLKMLSNQSLERNHHYYRRKKNDDNIFNKSGSHKLTNFAIGHFQNYFVKNNTEHTRSEEWILKKCLSF